MGNQGFCSACLKEHEIVMEKTLEIGENGTFYLVEYEYCAETNTLIETEELMRKNMKRYKTACLKMEIDKE